MPVRPGAEPFTHDGDDVAVLLIHGFTSTPATLLPWARALADAGRTVRVPLLPGHGTRWQDLRRMRWTDWYAEVEDVFQQLRTRSRVVVTAGLSMGGALALQLAQRHGPENGVGVDGVVVVNAAVMASYRGQWALPVGRWVVPSLPPVAGDIAAPGVVEDAYPRIAPHAAHSMLGGFREVAARLPEVRQPLLLFRSRTDHVVPAASSAMVMARVSSTDTEEVVLEKSYHVATLDHDAPLIAERSAAFVDRLAAVAAGGPS